MSAILLIAVPLLAAFLSILAKKIAPYLLLAVGVFNLIVLFLVPQGIIIIGGFDQPLGITLLLDTYSLLALAVINALITVIAFLNLKEFDKFSAILLLAMASLNGLVLTNDLFNLFVFLEISGIAAYLITTSNKKPVKTFHYLILGAVGSSLFLFGVVILYAMFGTLNMVDLLDKITATTHRKELVLPFTMMFIGLGVEAKLLPFNSWVKGVLGKSNTMSGPMIGAVYFAAIGFVLGRYMNNLFILSNSLMLVITILLAAGIIIGEAMAFSASKAREILLFSSIAQASIVALLFANGVIVWAAFYLIAAALSKTVLFLVVNKATKEVGSDEMSKLQGLFSNNIVVGDAATLATLSVMGLPLLVGFVIKLNFLTQLASAGQIWLIVVILIASVVEGIYFVRMLVKLWYKGENEINVKYNLSFKVVFVLIALALLAFGSYRAPLHQLNDNIDTVQQEVVNNG